MTLNELIELFLHSNQADWNNIACWGANSGPSYRDHFSFYNTREGEDQILWHDSHGNVAAYKPNLSVTIAYGLDVNYDTPDHNTINRPWATNFSDNSPASMHYIDLFYNNALVFRGSYCVVDGGRCKLPIAREAGGIPHVPRQYSDFIRTLNQIASGGDYDYYLGESGIEVREIPWD